MLACFVCCPPTEIFIRFNPTSYTVTEGGSVQLILQKVNTTEQAVTVVISTQEGTAGCKKSIISCDIVNVFFL